MSSRKDDLFKLRTNQQFLLENFDALVLTFEHMTNSEIDEIEELIVLLSEIKHNLPPKEKKMLYDILINNNYYNSYDELENEINDHQYFIKVRAQQNQYARKYTIKELYELLKDTNQSSKALVPYLLAIYLNYYKCERNIFFQKSEKQTDIKRIIKAHFESNRPFLLEIAQTIIQEQEMINFEAKEKKVNRIIQKAYSKLHHLQETQLQISENEYNQQIQALKKDTMHRISRHIPSKDYDSIPSITQFISQCIEIPVKRQNEEKMVEPVVQPFLNEDKIVFIERLFNRHHLYFKKGQIIEEMNQEPIFYDFYTSYGKTLEEESIEIRLEKLQEILSDIHNTGKKRLENCRRLISMINEDIEDIYETIAQETNTDAKKETINTDGPTFTIGKATVYKNSIQRNPMNTEYLLERLHPNSRNQKPLLESLIFEMGYDKVHSYLTKTPHLYIEDLEAIGRGDRLLRMEFQSILEDIEMFFRSSLTYYLTNKYDTIYQQTNGLPFYNRGYLQKNLFMDSDDHYQHIGQLNDRIDQELNNNNQQVISEFKQFKYSLPFSTSVAIMPFGWIISFFDNLNFKDRLEYLSQYFSSITPQTFSSWMNSLASLRNRCAHYQSLYRLTSLKELRPIMTKQVDSAPIDAAFKHSTLFYYAMIMSRLSPDILNINIFIEHLDDIFTKLKLRNSTFDLQTDYSFPENWMDILNKEKNSRVNIQLTRNQ